MPSGARGGGEANRTTIGYPGNVSAIYTYDAADRQSTLTVQRPGQPDANVVTSSGYEPSGPLASVTLGNGLVETRGFDTRYFPAAIQVDGASPVLDWQYTIDATGNPTAITDALDAANNRTYGYQDFQYYLTQGDGPWGNLAWSYDQLGNRLSETRDGVTDTYTYVANGAMGNSARLAEIQLGAGGTRIFAYDAAGNQTQVDSGGDVVDRTYDDAGRMSGQERTAAGASTDFLYDGRSYLRRASGVAPDTLGHGRRLLRRLRKRRYLRVGHGRRSLSAGRCPFHGQADLQLGRCPPLRRQRPDRLGTIVYFDDRPVAQFPSTGPLLYLTTDHLDTPIVASDITGGVEWEGGFETFWSGPFRGSGSRGVLETPWPMGG